MNRIDRLPVRGSAWLAAVAALVATSLSAMYSNPGGLAATAGLAFVLGGLVRSSRRLITLGGIALFAGVMAAGLARAPFTVVLPAVVSTIVAWDVGRYAVSIGRQLGRDAQTTPIQVVHIAGTLLVAGFSTAIGYGAYRSVAGGQPFQAVFFLLLAAILFVTAFSDRPSVPAPGLRRP